MGAEDMLVVVAEGVDVSPEFEEDGIGVLEVELGVVDRRGCVVDVGDGTSDLVIVTALTLRTVDAASTAPVGVTW